MSEKGECAFRNASTPPSAEQTLLEIVQTQILPVEVVTEGLQNRCQKLA
jgi:hypothetical protein